MKKIILTTLVLSSGIILAGCGTNSTDSTQLTIENDPSLPTQQMQGRGGRGGRMGSGDMQRPGMGSGAMMGSGSRMGSGNMLNLTEEEKTLMQELMQAKRDGDTAKETEAKTKLKALKPELFSGDDLKMPNEGRGGRMGSGGMMGSGDMQGPGMGSGDAQPMPPSEDQAN